MQFSIAIKRAHRGKAPVDWVATLRAAPGVEVQGEPLFDRCIVEAPRDAQARLCALLGEAFHVEPVTSYDRQSGSE